MLVNGSCQERTSRKRSPGAAASLPEGYVHTRCDRGHGSPTPGRLGPEPGDGNRPECRSHSQGRGESLPARLDSQRGLAGYRPTRA